MEFIRLTEDCMTKMFFRRIIYVVLYSHKDYKFVRLLNTDGNLYEAVYSEKFAELFPIIEKPNYSPSMLRNWARYDMEGGEIFVDNSVLSSYKKRAGIDDNCTEYEPNFEAALEAFEDFKIRRAERFTWNPGDLVFYSSKEECEKAAAKEGRKVVWYE